MRRPGFPHDPTMPGIPLAVDPAVMRGMFAHELQRTSGAEYTIDGCRLLRIRYRPEEHCFVHYELDLLSARSGKRTIAWLTGILYPDERPRRRLKKLLAACAGDPATDGWRAFSPGFYLPAPHMLVQAFPCDRRLPSLPRVAAGMSDLTAGLAPALGLDGRQTVVRDVEPVRYRALSGAVLRVSLEAADGRCDRCTGRRLYVKVGRAGEGAREARLLKDLRARIQSMELPFTVPRPLAYLDGLSALVVEEAPGQSLEQAVLTGGDIEGAARRTARGLAAFHQSKLMPPPATNAVINRAKVAADYVGWACPALAGEVRSMALDMAAVLARSELGPTHLDLKPDHVFLDGERVVFIDLDTFGAADPVLDLATLLARLAAMPDRLDAPTAHAETARRALADEYFARVPAHWRARLGNNLAIAAVQVASEFFRHQHPDWRELVPAWIARARRAADGHHPGN